MLEQKQIHKTFSMEEDFFDDCPVCQAQKAANEDGRSLTQEEFLQAAKEAEKLGGVSGVIY